MKEYNVVVLGSGGVGKSALTVKFMTGMFDEKYDPTIEDFYRKEINVDGSTAMLQILDTAGAEQFASMRDLYIKNGQGFLVVYSTVNAQTFIDIQPLKEQITRAKGGTVSAIVLVGNKCDLVANRVVSQKEGKALAQGWKCSFFETSAKTGYNVSDVFAEIIHLILKRKPKQTNGCCTLF